MSLRFLHTVAARRGALLLALATGVASLPQASLASNIGEELARFAESVDRTLNDPASGTGNTAYTYETSGGPNARYPIADLTGPEAGIFTDCSGWVNFALNAVSPLHQAAASAWRFDPRFNSVDADLAESRQPYARAFVLQSFFVNSDLPAAGSADLTHGFQRITRFLPATPTNPNGLQRGDIVAFCTGPWCDGERGGGDTGHTFIVVGPVEEVQIAADDPQQPLPGGIVLAVPIIDATHIRHYRDDRPKALPETLPAGIPARDFKSGGVGLGIMRLALDQEGTPLQTQFGPGDPFFPANPADRERQKKFGAVRLTDQMHIGGTLAVTPFPNASDLPGFGYASVPIPVSGPGEIAAQSGGMRLDAREANLTRLPD